MHFNLRAHEKDQVIAAYQHKENEEKNADLLGRSLLQRGRALVAFQEPTSCIIVQEIIRAHAWIHAARKYMGSCMGPH